MTAMEGKHLQLMGLRCSSVQTKQVQLLLREGTALSQHAGGLGSVFRVERPKNTRRS